MDVRAAIQAGQYGDAETYLLHQLEASGSDALSICQATTAERVRADWWDDLRGQIDRLTTSGKHLCAVNLSLSSHMDRPDGVPMEPVVETSFYAERQDSCFARMDEQTLYDRSADYPAPWTGRFDYPGQTYDMSGLAALTECVLSRSGTEEDVWAGTFLLLRFQQCVRTLAKEVGLPVPLLVTIGEHGFSPWLVTIVSQPKRTPYIASSDRTLPIKRHKHTALFLETLNHLAICEGFPPETRNDKLCKMLRSNLKKMSHQGVLQNSPYEHVQTWNLSNQDLQTFYDLLEAYYAPDRDPAEAAPKFSPVEQKRKLFGLFG